MISLITAKRLHRELWFWLELNPGKLKHQWPGWKWYEKDLPDKAKDRKSTRLNSSHIQKSRMPSSA